MQSIDSESTSKKEELNAALREIQDLKNILQKMNLALEMQGENLNLIQSSVANIKQQVQTTNATLHDKQIAETHFQRIQYLLTIVTPYVNPIFGIGWILATTSTKTLQTIPGVISGSISVLQYYFNKSYY